MEEELTEQTKHLEGKDELNLAEFPLSAIADRHDPEQKTMVFEDRIWDRSRGDNITRKLLITAADEYGLPTALDDEVILGLVQLSRLQGFADRRVSFTRYQLIQLLGWRDEGKSYERIETSLNRWIGVTLYYQNAWRDRENACWVDEKFHLLDNVTLYDRERLARDRATQTALPLSSFTWNEVVFRSFRAGNLKSLDFDFYRRLESAVAKRLYRFLDKRLFHRPRWEFNLQELCWEHVGLARSYDSANLKRKLRPAIAELERNHFIQELPDADRFRKVRTGEWRVLFERAGRGGAKADAPPPVDEPLAQALIARGVTPSTAREVVGKFSAERIQQQLEVFDWLVSQKDPRIRRSPAGFLVSAIRGEYEPPRDFQSRRQEVATKANAAEREAKRLVKVERQRCQEEMKLKARREAIASFWGTLSDEERPGLELEALGLASGFEQTLLEGGGSLASATRQKLLDEFALRSLEANG